jgi:chemotaxis protein CheX
VCGSVVFSLSREVAYKAVEILIGHKVTEINADVVDAVGELTNMIAGGAKAGLAQYRLSLGLPNVIVGKNHTICFPGNIQPICIAFDTQWGPISIEVGLDTRSARLAEPAARVKTT